MIHSLKFKVSNDETLVYDRTPLKQFINKNFKPTIATSNIENKETKKNNSRNVSEFNFLGK